MKAPVDKRVLTPGGAVIAEIPNNLDHDQARGSIVDPATGATRWSTQLGDDDSLFGTARTLFRGTGCATTLRD